MSDFDFIKMGATHRQLQDIVLARLAEREAEVDHRETEAIILLCAELASIAFAEDRRPQWGAIAYLASKMKEASHG
jgi:hypothetical protein